MSKRLVVVAGRRFVREALADALAAEPAVASVRAAGSQGDLTTLLEREPADVVVADLGPRLTLASLREAVPPSRNPRVVAVATAVGDPAAADVTTVDRRDGLTGIRHALTGTAPALEANDRTPRPRVSRTGLSLRERDVLVLLSRGLTTGQASSMLGISPKTIDHHKRRLFDKLGATGQAHAVAIAHRDGMLSGTPSSHDA